MSIQRWRQIAGTVMGGACLAWGSPSMGGVAVYPATDSLVECKDFTLEVDGCKVWTESLTKPMPDDAPGWFRDADVKKQLAVNIASFGCDGPCSLTITPGTERKIDWLFVEPKSKNIPGKRIGNQIVLALPGPCKLLLQMGDKQNNRLPDLLVFANPLETDIPPTNAPRTRVFGPGVHEAGWMTLKDGDRIYLAPGALVYGGFRGSPHGAKVFGRGTLDGSHTEDHHSFCFLTNASDVVVEGITIRCGKNWQNKLLNCDNVRYRNVKVLSFVPCGDGIDPCDCRNIRIEDCFFRCSDDCISVKGMNGFSAADPHVPSPCRTSDMVVSGCCMMGYGFGDGFTIGGECDTEFMENILVKDCDILQARGGNGFGGHSGFSVTCDGPATVRNIRFEDIRVEANVPRNFTLAVDDASFITSWRKNPLWCVNGLQHVPAKPGHIKGISLKNVRWDGDFPPIVLQGYDREHQVEDVSFEGCTVRGKPLEEDQIKKVNTFIGDVKVLDATGTSRRQEEALLAAGAPTILAFGDSITAGGEFFVCYRQVLIPALREKGVKFEFIGPNRDTISAHAGYSGKSTRDLLGMSKDIYTRYPADIVLLHSGHNSFSQDKPVPGIIRDTEAIIANIREINPNVTILLAQVIPAGKLPKYSYIPELNQELASLTQRLVARGWRIVLVNQAEGFDLKADTVSDQVHPNASGAKKMAAKWMDALLPLIEAKNAKSTLTAAR